MLKIIQIAKNNKGFIHFINLLIFVLAILAVWFIYKSHKMGNIPSFTSELISDTKKIFDAKIQDTNKKKELNRILDTTQESVDNYYRDRRYP